MADVTMPIFYVVVKWNGALTYPVAGPYLTYADAREERTKRKLRDSTPGCEYTVAVTEHPMREV